MLVPQVVFSFIGGVVADAKNKKLILVYGNVLRAILVVVLALSPGSLTSIFMIAILVSVITQFYIPAEPPIIPHLLKKRLLVVANSMFGMSLFGSILIAFVVTGPLIQIFGRSGIFVIISGLFLVSSVFSFLLPDIHSRGKGIRLSGILDTLRHLVHVEFVGSLSVLRQKGSVGRAFFLLIFSQVVVLMIATIIPDYASSSLNVAAENLSLILFAPAALGMIIAAFLLSGPLGSVKFGKLMTIGVFLSALCLFMFPFVDEVISLLKIETPLVYGAAVVAFFAGFANAFIFVPSQAIIQHSVPERFRSKIYGLLFSIIGLFSILPLLVVGGAADFFGVEMVLIALSVIIFGIGLYHLRYWDRYAAIL